MDVRDGLKVRLEHWVSLIAQLPDGAGQSDTATKVCDQALYLRELRNLIVHGLLDFNAHPDLGAAVHIRCAVGGFEEPTGEFVSFTVADLEHFTQGVDACRRAMQGLSAFNYVVEYRTGTQSFIGYRRPDASQLD